MNIAIQVSEQNTISLRILAKRIGPFGEFASNNIKLMYVLPCVSLVHYFTECTDSVAVTAAVYSALGYLDVVSLIILCLLIIFQSWSRQVCLLQVLHLS